MAQKSDTFKVANANESTGFLLWQVTNQWQRSIKKALEKFDLTHSQFVLMASIHWLQMQKIEVTQIILSSHTKIDPMTTSTVLRTLERKGYIVRTESSKDTRAKLIQLSDKGVEVIKPAIKIVEMFDDKFFSIIENKMQFNKELLKLI